MARYKHYDYSQMKLLPVSFKEQILSGTFEYTLNELIDEEIDLSVFEERYCNDETGAPAYDPAILLKIILYAYSRGITQSREIARLCRENIVFMALSADTTPHFTTIADFIATLEREIDRHRPRPLSIFTTAGHRRAGVCQYPIGTRLKAVQLARDYQSQHAVAALLSRPQHRQDTALRQGEAPQKACGNAMKQQVTSISCRITPRRRRCAPSFGRRSPCIVRRPLRLSAIFQ